MVGFAIALPTLHYKNLFRLFLYGYLIIGGRIKLIAQRINEGSPLVIVVDFKICCTRL
jgi:hypothetical protein